MKPETKKAIEKVAKLMEVSEEEVLEEAVLLFEGLIETAFGGYKIRRSKLGIILKKGKLSIEEIMGSHTLTTTLLSAAQKRYREELEIQLKSMKKMQKNI